MSKSITELIAENWHEVTPDQLKPGTQVAVLYSLGQACDVFIPSDAVLSLWKRDPIKSCRYFVQDPPAPVEEYASGTLARITIGWDGAQRNAIRVADEDPPQWISGDGDNWVDRNLSHVEVIAHPDGTRPVPKVTDEQSERARNFFIEYQGGPEASMKAALEDYEARKFGGQA